jgi:hypothetical protein
MASTQEGTGSVGNGPMTRQELRAVFFAPERAEIHPTPIEWNGVTLDWYRPTIDQVDKARERVNAEGRNFMVQMIMEYTYSQGQKDEKFFEEEDYDKLVALPLSGEFNEVVRRISEALDLRVEERVKN